jgi:hypothetical protein
VSEKAGHNVRSDTSHSIKTDAKKISLEGCTTKHYLLFLGVIGSFTLILLMHVFYN